MLQCLHNMEGEKIKDFYKTYDDRISAKRWKSKYPLRAYAHEKQYASVLSYVMPGMKVLDAGCGDGVLSLMMAEKGAVVTGTDLSVPNIDSSKHRAREAGLEHKVSFMVADLENLPFEDNTFDLVVSSHVLEHIPDFDKGLREVMRVTKSRAVVAIPTIVNPCSWVQVGGGWYYLKGLRSFLSLPLGFGLMVLTYLSGQDGVDEGYVGSGMPHVFRFISVMKDKIRKNGFTLVEYEASSVCLPFFSFLLPVVKMVDQFKKKPLLRNCGYGTTFVIEK
jgi:ubiquinone/menaquinone biosynthesis C-methylase UbiE